MTNPDHQFDALSEIQKRLLREVAKGLSSKAMSREFGLEPRTIDVYISRAGKALGCADRQSAAAAFAKHEATMLTRCISTSGALASVEENGQPSLQRGLSRFLKPIQPPPIGGREHDYDLTERLVASFKIALWGFVTIIAISMVISALFWIFPKT